jgi:hypothetical protein
VTGAVGAAVTEASRAPKAPNGLELSERNLPDWENFPIWSNLDLELFRIFFQRIIVSSGITEHQRRNEIDTIFEKK